MEGSVTRIILGIGGNLVPYGYSTLRQGCDAVVPDLEVCEPHRAVTLPAQYRFLPALQHVAASPSSLALT